MIRRIRLALVILVCVVLQTTLFTHLQIDGVAPDIGLVAVLAVAWEEGPFGGLVFITAGAIVGQSGMLSFDSLRIVIIASIYDAVIAAIVFPLVRRAARRDHAPATWRMR